MTDHLRIYRAWFYAAAIYNVAWGAAVIAFPVRLSRLAGLEVATVIPLVQVIGMMVGVYAIGYYLLAKEPLRYAGLIWIALGLVYLFFLNKLGASTALPEPSHPPEAVQRCRRPFATEQDALAR